MMIKKENEYDSYIFLLVAIVSTVCLLHRFFLFENKRKRIKIARTLLATEPAFGREFIIGNLKEIFHSIEKYLIEEPRGSICKEVLPFLCVVNPPRHGKSLLLDTV